MIYTHLITDWLEAARARECTQQSRYLRKIIEILLKTMSKNLFDFSAIPSCTMQTLSVAYIMVKNTRANTLNCVHDAEKCAVSRVTLQN